MSSLSRRRFIAAGGVTAGAAIVTAKATAAEAATAPAAATSVTLDESVQQHQLTASQPIMLFVSDPAHGDVTILSGANEVVYNDPTLVARIQRVIRRAQV